MNENPYVRSSSQARSLDSTRAQPGSEVERQQKEREEMEQISHQSEEDDGDKSSTRALISEQDTSKPTPRILPKMSSTVRTVAGVFLAITAAGLLAIVLLLLIAFIGNFFVVMHTLMSKHKGEWSKTPELYDGH